MGKPYDQIRMGVQRLWKRVVTLATMSQLHPLPIIEARTYYRKEFLASDLRASLNVALLAFPQGMAYAVIAGLPIEYGIYGSIIASIVGPIFSGSRFIMLGPTNATSVLLPVAIGTLAVARDEKLQYVPILLVLAGVFLLVGAFFRVANLTQYISRSVVTGYITAAAVYIIVNQMKKVADLNFSLDLNATLIDAIWMTVEKMPEANMAALMLSIMTAGLYLLLQKHYKILPNVAITLVVMSVVGTAMNYGMGEVKLIGELFPDKIAQLKSIDVSSWRPTLPSFSYESVRGLAGPAMVIAFLSILEGSSIGKSLAARSGEKLNTNQEMLAMGMANIACGFGGGMPASGSLTRSKLNADTGAKTPLASIFCGFICLGAALLLGPYIRFIPTSALGVLVIFIGFSLISKHSIRLVMKSTRSDATVFMTTFISALLIRLDFAIIIGAAVSIILFLRKVSAPELVEYNFNEQGNLYEMEDKDIRPNPQVSIVHVEGELFFGAAELFRDQMRRVCDDPNLKVVILRLKNAYHLDATSVMALEELIQYLNEKERHLIVSGARKDVYRVFKNSGLIDVLGKENFFMGTPTNPNMSTRNALKRAQEMLGGQKADVKIYFDPNK
jgi:SulP family sulfate permease